MTAFYNEVDPYVAQWLRNLIVAGHIAPGIVDERPIQEIEPWELMRYTQCHFFAGIGIWSLALRRAGWSDDQPIWTGSCPCQPFSAAGQRKGISDERHLWPTWFKLIDQCKPPIVVGEQVASKDGLDWLDLVSANLEASDYAFAAADLCAAGFGGAHIRQRLYFVGLADASNEGEGGRGSYGPGKGDFENDGEAPNQSLRSSSFVGLADDDDARLEGWNGVPECGNQRADGPGSMVGRLADAKCDGWGQHQPGRQEDPRIAVRGRGEISGNSPNGLEHTDMSGQHGRASSREQSLRNIGDGANKISDSGDQRQIASRWLDADWLLCRNPVGEPSWRPVEPGTFPLDNAVADRMGLLRAYGNALDAETATNFCEVVREIADDLRPLEREFDL